MARDLRGAAATALLALGVSWSIGNVGAITGQLAQDLDVSLAFVGVLSGTLLLGTSTVGTLLTPAVAARIGVVRTMAVAAVLSALGNAAFALSPDVALLVVTRCVAGFGLGLAIVAGPVFARATGGVRRVGLFGAANQLGIAGSLGLGALLADLGASWRSGFVVTAVLALSPLPFLVGRPPLPYQRRRGRGFWRRAVVSGRAWRLTLLFLAVFGIPLTLGSWLVQFLQVDWALGATLAGALSFVLFGVSAAGREAGGWLATRGLPPGLLLGGTVLLAGAGLAILATVAGPAWLAVAGVVLAGVGFSVPYGPGIDRVSGLWPRDPTEPVALVSVVGGGLPVLVVPLIGALFEAGMSGQVFWGLAAFATLAGLLNLRPVAGSLDPADLGSGPGTP